jgi:hypothetical protein
MPLSSIKLAQAPNSVVINGEGDFSSGADTFKSYPSGTIFEINYKVFALAHAQNIFAAIKDAPNGIEIRLDISFKFGPGSAAPDLAELLASNPATLKRLYTQGYTFGEQGFKLIAGAMEYNTHLLSCGIATERDDGCFDKCKQQIRIALARNNGGQLAPCPEPLVYQADTMAEKATRPEALQEDTAAAPAVSAPAIKLSIPLL